MECRFNLSRAPWWGGQYERLIGLFKRAFHKTIGNGTLTWEELEEVVLDVEVTFNNRPLNYLENEFSVLTPSSMLNVNPYLMPKVKPHQIEEMDLRKRAKFLHNVQTSCMETLGSRIRLWSTRTSSAGNRQADIASEDWQSRDSPGRRQKQE